MKKQRYLKGAITVEAAIVMPVFICVAISLAMIIKLIYVHDILQHAMDEAAKDLASYAYIYHVSQMQEMDEAVETGLEAHSAQAEEHLDTFLDAYDKLEKAFGKEGSPGGKVQGSQSLNRSLEELLKQGAGTLVQNGELTEAGREQADRLQEVLEELWQDPKKELESMGWLLAKGIYSEAKNVVAVPVIRQAVKGYLTGGKASEGDQELDKLNIYKGFKGLDFYSSAVFEGNEDIKIVVKYRVILPMPFKILPDLYLVQQSVSRTWLEGGDGRNAEEQSIWELPNKERGMKIEAMYGGNLPYDFPRIDIYEESTGTGTSIKSINLNSKTYQQNSVLKRVLTGYADAIGEVGSLTYKGKEYPLRSKKMILVIPKDSVKEGNREILEYIKGYASGKGIDLTISEL
jgi:hypothetical protein